MIVAKKFQQLLIPNKHRARVQQVIPSAKAIELRGRPFVALKHGLEETRVLRNLGIEAPSPVRYYYPWSGRYTPMDHQADTVEFLTLHPRCFCLNDMGTGKTLSGLWAFDYLRSLGIVHKMLIVSPLSTLESVWADEVFTHFPHLTYSVLHASSSARRLKLLAQDADIYIINHDGLKVAPLLAELTKRDDIDLILLDEAAAFRNAKTKRWEALDLLVNGNAKLKVRGREWAWAFTGSPTPNAPTDAWAQVKLFKPSAVPRFFGAFRDMVMRQKGPFKWVARPNSADVISHVMQPSIRFKRDDCIDLPPTIYTSRHVEMTPEQHRMYQDMVKRLRAENSAGQITAVNESVKAMKLMQIAAGVAYGADGEDIIIPTDRPAEVAELIEQAEGKAIVFVPLVGALEYVAEELRKRGYDVAVVHGQTPKNARVAIFRDFQKTKSIDVIVAHPQCMSHGLTLTAASLTVWYMPMYDNETYEQANARTPRPGQKNTTVIVHIAGSEAERRAYRNLQDKKSMQGTLLDLLSEYDS